MAGSPLNWPLYTERATGHGHPNANASGDSARPDVINRAVRQMLSASGYDPDAALFKGLPAPVYNVRAYYDATVAVTWESAFTAAFTDCKDTTGGRVGGGVIAVPAAVYNFNSGITVDGLNMHLKGDGRYGARLIGNGFAGPVLTVTSRPTGSQLGTSISNLSIEQATPLFAGSIGIHCDLPLDCRFDHVWTRDATIGWKITGSIYTQFEQCDATGCTTSVRMLAGTLNSATYPCQFYHWNGGRLWGNVSPAAVTQVQAIVDDSGGQSAFWTNLNVSGCQAGALACVDFSGLGPVGYGPSVVMKNAFFENNTSTLAELQHAGSLFSPSTFEDCTFISAAVSKGIYVKSGEVHLQNTQGVPLNAAAPNLQLDSGARAIVFGPAPVVQSINAGASISQLSSSAIVVPNATIGALGTKITSHFSGTKTWDPASVADGAMTSTTVTVTGALVGDTVTVGFSVAVVAGMLLVGAVTANDTVTVTLYNKSGGAVDLASGTLRADAWHH